MRLIRVNCLFLVILLLTACTSTNARVTSTIPFLRPTRTKPVPSPSASVAITPEIAAPIAPAAGDEPYPPPQSTEAALSETTPAPTTLFINTPTPINPILDTPTLLPSSTLTTTINFAPTVVERLPEPAIPPPAQLASTVSIWHSWEQKEIEALWSVIGSFQQVYPNVGFELFYVPVDDLKKKFASEAYLGSGPGILLAPAEWGPELAKSELLLDFTPHVNPDFLAMLNPAALGTGRYQGELISLPHALRGVLLYRNQSIIAQPAVSFEQLVQYCQTINRLGVVGGAIDRGIYFSGGHLEGLGGKLLDEHGNPAFNNATGLEWIDLIKSLDQLGITTFNSNRDRQLFEQEQAGIIVETSSNLLNLAEAIGTENLVIDPWPSYRNGHLAGYVLADSVYLNINLTGNDLVAALAFTGYFLAPEVQYILAEVGHIPSMVGIPVRDRLIGQAMTAFANGTSFPVNPEAQVYWNVLESALLDILNQGVDPASALQQAFDVITVRLTEIRK